MSYFGPTRRSLLSSFHRNGRGEKDDIVMSHSLYHKLGRIKDLRQAAYVEFLRHMLTTLILAKYAMPVKLARHWGMIIFVKKLKVS
jgi:hypothetical protein